MVVYWKDGTHSRFYSRDEKKSLQHVKQKSINKFLNKLQTDYLHQYMTALIYNNEENGTLIHKFVNGKQVQ